MKAVAIAITLLPLYGCASLPSFSGLNPAGLFGPEPSTPKVPATAVAETNQIGLPKDVAIAVLEGQNARKAGDLNKAAHIFSQLVLVTPDDARVLGEYGKTLASLGRSDDAVAFLERAMQLAPSEWSLYSALGVAYDQKANYRVAQALYDRALALKPGEASVLNNAALSRMQAGDLDGAERLLHTISPETPDYARVAQNLTLIEKLKSAQLAKPAAAAIPEPIAAAVPMPIISAVQPPPALPVTVATPAPAAPVEIAAVVMPKPPVVSVALEPAPKAAVSAPTPLELLKADPTVRIQPIPRDDLAAAAEELPAKPAAAKVAALSSAPANQPPAAQTPVKQAAAPVVAAASPAKQQTATHAAASAAYYVQAGAFFTPDKAGQEASALDRLGARVMTGTVQGKSVFRVRIGPFRNASQAGMAVEQAQALGHTDLQIVAE